MWKFARHEREGVRWQDKKTEIYKKIVVEVAEARPGVLKLMDQVSFLASLGLLIGLRRFAAMSACTAQGKSM